MAHRLRLTGDERLMETAAAGSEAAFAVLYERHHQALYRYCRSIVRDEHDAQDVLQSTMAKAWAALGHGPPDAPPRAWLFRIAHNESVSLLRARKATSDLDETRQLTAASVEGQAEQHRRLEMLTADLAELPERQRAALVMRELNDLSHAEIAAALETSVSGAKQAIFDARVGLLEFARGRDMACAEIQRLISDADGRVLRGRVVRAHLRDCADCRALRDAMARRRSDLAALAPPLPAAASSGLLSHLVGGGGLGGGAGPVAALTGKAATTTLTAKLAVGAVVVVAAGAGAGLPRLARHDASRPVAAGAAPATSGRAVPAVSPGPPAPVGVAKQHAAAVATRPRAVGAASPRRRPTVAGRARGRAKGEAATRPRPAVDTSPARRHGPTARPRPASTRFPGNAANSRRAAPAPSPRAARTRPASAHAGAGRPASVGRRVHVPAPRSQARRRPKASSAHPPTPSNRAPSAPVPQPPAPPRAASAEHRSANPRG